MRARVARACACVHAVRECSQIPSAISTAAIQNVAGGSAGQISSDSTTPNSGAIEKYAPVRAAEMTQCDDEHEADPVTAGSASRQP